MPKKDTLIHGINRAKITGSSKSVYNHKQEARRFVEQLRKNGFGVTKWENLSNKHVSSVVESWRASGMSEKTIKEYLSGIRAIARTYGNELISNSNNSFGLGSEGQKGLTDKSGNEAVYESALKKLEEGTLDEKCLAVQLEYMRHLGLRAEEARKLDALHSVREVSPEGRTYIRVVDGTKGGKERWVPVSEKAEKALSKGAALQKLRGARNLMNPAFKKEKIWVYYAYRTARDAGLTKAAGFTFHSARHRFAQELFRRSAGFDPPVKYLTKQEFINNAIRASDGEWQQRYETACRIVEKALGHGTGREDIRSTYIGRI